jgi:hypothetical protein
LPCSQGLLSSGGRVGVIIGADFIVNVDSARASTGFSRGDNADDDDVDGSDGGSISSGDDEDGDGEHETDEGNDDKRDAGGDKCEEGDEDERVVRSVYSVGVAIGDGGDGAVGSEGGDGRGANPCIMREDCKPKGEAAKTGGGAVYSNPIWNSRDISTSDADIDRIEVL